ncbi:MAG: ParB/RepB/Spo0J family partition protein, partial [Clostridia bacterium]|nr:ParB/RepB/Spo0J family partition protein [Clostridia bacterium]
MRNNRGLGRGLSALFSETEEDYGKSLIFSEEADTSLQGVTEIDLSKIFANPNQPRKVFDETALNELADSIAKHGVISPIIVNKSGDRYMIIAGERRFRASKIAGLSKIPAIVKTYTERQIKEISLIENLQREDLNPIEAATAMKSLMDDYGLTQEDLADRLGKSRPAIANTLRLLSLSAEVIKMVQDGSLSAGHARAIITVPKIDQIAIAKQSVKGGLSVRETEKLVKEYFLPPEEKAKRKAKAELSAELKELIVDMQRTFGTKVNAIGN